MPPGSWRDPLRRLTLRRRCVAGRVGASVTADTLEPSRAAADARRSDVEAERTQLLATILGDLVRAPRRHPDPVDPDVVHERLGAAGENGARLVLDDVGQRAGR